MPNTAISKGAFILLLAGSLVLASANSPAKADSIVRFDTSLGAFSVQLYDNDTPITVTNFLNYINDGDYTNSFFHRLASGFVLQGGGFTYDPSVGFDFTDNHGQIVNEYSPLRSNLYGTIAMAKLGGDPDSASNQFFFNLDDNSSNLDNQNGGFTVFGHVLGDGMEVVGKLAGFAPNIDDVQVWNASGSHSAWDSLPLINYTGGDWTPNLEMVNSVTVFSTGDFNYDHAVDDLDIDILSAAAIRGGPITSVYDLDGDDDVDADDYTYMIEEIIGAGPGTAWGDGNLDNATDVSDLSIWLSNRMTSGHTNIGDGWSQGDWNGDGAVDVSDLSVWLSNRMTSYDSFEMASTDVPEPASMMLLLATAPWLLRCKRRRAA